MEVELAEHGRRGATEGFWWEARAHRVRRGWRGLGWPGSPSGGSLLSSAGPVFAKGPLTVSGWEHMPDVSRGGDARKWGGVF